MSQCLICNNPVKTYKHPRFEMTFHECEVCQFIYKDQSHHLDQEAEKTQYDFHQNDEENIGYVNFLTNFIDAAVVPFIKNGRALDFGSGPNPVLSKILQKTYHFDCAIYDPFYAENDHVLGQTYDLITSTEVVEHFFNPLPMFKLFSKLMHQDSILSIMTLFHPKNQNSFFDWFYIRDLTHVSFYTPKTFDYIANQLGLKVIFTNDHRYITLKKIK